MYSNTENKFTSFEKSEFGDPPIFPIGYIRQPETASPISYQDQKNMITIQISDELFWGFKYHINRTIASGMTKHILVETIKNSMHVFFKKHNLLCLDEKIDSLDLHLHTDPSMFDKSTNIFYACTHKHEFTC